MGANSYTTDVLVNNILLVSHMPLSNNTFTAPEILTLATRELQTAVMKQILASRGGFYMDYEEMDPLPTGLYPIPTSAIAQGLANVEIIQNPTIIQVSPIEESEQFSVSAPNSLGYGFFMRGNFVQILPLPNQNTVRLWYFKRPSTLIPTSQACLITSITGDSVTVASVPSNIQIGSDIDFIKDQPNFDVYSEDIILDITGTTITFDTGTVPLDLQIGDWIALHDQTPVPQIPVEFRPLLEQRVVVKIYEIQGYLDKAKMAQAKLDEITQVMTSLITNRVKSKTKVIMQSTGGLLGNAGYRTNFPAGRE